MIIKLEFIVHKITLRNSEVLVRFDGSRFEPEIVPLAGSFLP